MPPRPGSPPLPVVPCSLSSHTSVARPDSRSPGAPPHRHHRIEQLDLQLRMLRLAPPTLLALLLAACTASMGLPERSLLYEETYDPAFAAAVEAAQAARLPDGLALPVTSVEYETGIVQLHGDPLGEGVVHTVTIVVATTVDDRAVILVRAGSSGPSARGVADAVAARVIEELDARLTPAVRNQVV